MACSSRPPRRGSIKQSQGLQRTTTHLLQRCCRNFYFLVHMFYMRIVCSTITICLKERTKNPTRFQTMVFRRRAVTAFALNRGTSLTNTNPKEANKIMQRPLGCQREKAGSVLRKKGTKAHQSAFFCLTLTQCPKAGSRC